MNLFHQWLISKEGIWLFYVLLTSITLELITVIILVAEYKYDERKDVEKNKRKTRTSKKTTTDPKGITTTEETTEVSEPVQESKHD